MKKIICFDLEGPLSPQDHAYETMRSIPDGEKVFEVISHYDDLLTLEGRENYEPGDALKLIIPFLILGKVKEADLRRISNRAPLVNGSKDLIRELKETGWQVFIASTSYEQHASQVAQRLEVEKDHVFCTKFPLDDFYPYVTEKDFLIFDSTRDYISSYLWIGHLSSGQKDEEIKIFLDKFFWEVLEDTSIAGIFRIIEVMGGSRKVQALKTIEEKTRTPLKEMVVVGDSITDFKMLRAVDRAGGLAIVFNGNEYALPHGTVGVNAYDLRSLLFLLGVWERKGRGGARQRILNYKNPSYHWLKGINAQKRKAITELHKHARTIVRGQGTAKLG